MKIAQSNSHFDVVRAFEGLRNGRAITLLIGAFILTLVLNILGILTKSAVGISIGTALFWFLGNLIFLFGISAAGVVLMDVARGLPPPSFGDAIFAGVLSAFKIIVMMVLGAVAFALYWALLYLVFLICKIPGLGPVIYAVAFPVAVVLTAFVLVGSIIAFTVMGSAVWEGHALSTAIARVYAIAAHRAIEVLIHYLILSFMLVVIGFVVLGFLLFSFVAVGGLSSIAIFGGLTESRGGELGWLGNLSILFSIFAGAGAGSEDMRLYMLAGLFGAGAVFSIALAGLYSVFLMGINLVYLSAVEGIDFSAAEAKLSEGFAQARQKAGEMQEHARQRTQELQERARQAEEQRRAVAQATTVSSAANMPTAQAGQQCPKCGATITGSDSFCGGCGYKLT